MNPKEMLEFLSRIYSQIPDWKSPFWTECWIKDHPRLAKRLLRFKSDASAMMKPVQFEVARVELEERRLSMQLDAFPQFRTFVPPPLTEEQKELIAFNDRVPENLSDELIGAMGFAVPAKTDEPEHFDTEIKDGARIRLLLPDEEPCPATILKVLPKPKDPTMKQRVRYKLDNWKEEVETTIEGIEQLMVKEAQ